MNIYRNKIILIGILFLAVFLFGFHNAKASTTVSGIISTDATWNLSGSPFNISGNIQISSGATLTIEPGVTVNGNGNEIELWGNLDAIGISGSKIILNNVVVEVENGASSGLVNIQFAEINYGCPYKGEQFDGGLTLKNSTLNNISEIYLWYPKEDCYIEKNIFVNSEKIFTIVMHGAIYIKNNSFYKQKEYIASNNADYGPGVFLEKNSFMDTSKIALILTPTYDGAKMTATNNYWNTTDANIINGMIYDKNDDLSCGDFIDYTPYLFVSDPDTPLLSASQLSVDKPSANPASGTYAESQKVTLNIDADASQTYYTLDGSEPSSDKNLYSGGQIAIDGNNGQSVTLKSISYNTFGYTSEALEEKYIFDKSSMQVADENNDENPQVSTNTPTILYSSNKKTKKKITLTFSNLVLTKKKWVKVRLNGRKVTTAGVRRSGNDSIVIINLKYGKWATGNYNLSMSYKNQVKVSYKTKKGKAKFRKSWESGNVNSENILSII